MVSGPSSFRSRMTFLCRIAAGICRIDASAMQYQLQHSQCEKARFSAVFRRCGRRGCAAETSPLHPLFEKHSVTITSSIFVVLTSNLVRWKLSSRRWRWCKFYWDWLCNCGVTLVWKLKLFRWYLPCANTLSHQTINLTVWWNSLLIAVLTSLPFHNEQGFTIGELSFDNVGFTL